MIPAGASQPLGEVQVNSGSFMQPPASSSYTIELRWRDVGEGLSHGTGICLVAVQEVVPAPFGGQYAGLVKLHFPSYL